MKVLQVGAEVFPLIKTGGLADVLGALPQALCAQGADLRLLLPGLPGIIDAVLHARRVCHIGPVFGAARVSLLRAQMPYTHLPVYVIDAPFLYRRAGGPYQDSHGTEWADNLQRFGLLGWVAAQLAQGELDAGWTPEVVHAHDWHAAMSCAYLHAHPACAAASVFTIHNLAFQGLFPARRLWPAGFVVALHVAVGARVPRAAVVHEGGAEVRRPRHHGQPVVCARDRHAGVRRRPGGRDPRPRRRRVGHPQRHRYRGLGSRADTAPCRSATAPTCCRARPRARRHCRRSSGWPMNPPHPCSAWSRA